MTGTPGTAPITPLRILLADDNAADRTLLTTVLTGHETPIIVESACDGADVLAMLRDRRRTPPHLVLLDLKMPRMDGLEALAAIKADAVLRRLPVIMLTTSDAPEDVRCAHELGADGYLTKPRTLPEMMNLAQAVVDLLTFALPLPRQITA